MIPKDYKRFAEVDFAIASGSGGRHATAPAALRPGGAVSATDGCAPERLPRARRRFLRA